jgi:hypothetical protein
MPALYLQEMGDALNVNDAHYLQETQKPVQALESAAIEKDGRPLFAGSWIHGAGIGVSRD